MSEPAIDYRAIVRLRTQALIERLRVVGKNPDSVTARYRAEIAHHDWVNALEIWKANA